FSLPPSAVPAAPLLPRMKRRRLRSSPRRTSIPRRSSPPENCWHRRLPAITLMIHPAIQPSDSGGQHVPPSSFVHSPRLARGSVPDAVRRLAILVRPAARQAASHPCRL